MIRPIGDLVPPSFVRHWEPGTGLLADSFVAGAAPFFYAQAPTHYLSLYWRLTDAAINAEFWINLSRSLRDFQYRMLMTATRPLTG